MKESKDCSTEEKILEAAKEVFMKYDLYGARMQDIANTAGINKACFIIISGIRKSCSTRSLRALYPVFLSRWMFCQQHASCKRTPRALR